MKKIFFSVLAIAAIVACTKSEVQYESSAEIGFAPAVKNITKAAMGSGTLDSNVDLGIWAFWNGTTGSIEDTPTYANYTDSYLANALFVNRKGDNGATATANWGGETSYPWPTNGALVFAGYTIPPTDVATLLNPSYTLNGPETSINTDDDIMTFDYAQTVTDNKLSSFDLCWFGRTAESFNYRTDDIVVPVVLSHALSWLKFNVKGEDSSIGWKITQITLNDISSEGTGTCIGSGAGAASWNCNSYTTDLTLFDNSTNPIVLSAVDYDIETTVPANGSTPATVNNDIIVIPQTINAGSQLEAARTQHTLTITYQFPVGDSSNDANWKTDTKKVLLDIDKDSDDNKWVSGTKYTYTLTFKANEILVAPSYGDWADGTTPGITVE